MTNREFTHVVWTFGTKSHGACKVGDAFETWYTLCGRRYTVIAEEREDVNPASITCKQCHKVLRCNPSP